MLVLAACNASDAWQRFAVDAAARAVRFDGGLCVAFAGVSYDAPLALLPCNASSPQQAWVYDASLTAFSNPTDSCGGLGGACIQWSGQELAPGCTSSPPRLGPGCIWGTWPSSSPTSWNNAVLVDSPEAGMLQSLFAAGGGPSPSGLCASAFVPPPPPPPPLPTPEVLAWSRLEVGCLIDYDMCTFAGTQGCSCSSAPPPADTWRPTSLDTDSWIEAGVSAGCQYFVYVAKHVCGFLAWNSTVVTQPAYAYSTLTSSTPIDATSAFIASAQKYGVGFGMYYSVNDNSRANMCAGSIGPNPAPGQLNLSTAQYNDIVIAHLTELWSKGDFLELWFDGGYSPSIAPQLKDLFKTLQPHAVAFQGQGLMPSPTRWIGTEAGSAPYPTWSTCDADSYGAGSPTSGFWFPAETDFTVLQGDSWFFDPSKEVRPPAELRAMYEASVGHNTNALIGLGVPPNGTMAGTAQAAALAGLGQYVAACYGAPIVSASDVNATTVTLSPSAPVVVGRVVVQEDQSLGQLVRGFTVTARLADGSSALLDSGPSIGNKKIGVVRPALAGVTQVTLNYTSWVAGSGGAAQPVVRFFAIYGDCDSL
jgi:alpha-L-fucosidase